MTSRTLAALAGTLALTGCDFFVGGVLAPSPCVSTEHTLVPVGHTPDATHPPVTYSVRYGAACGPAIPRGDSLIIVHYPRTP